VLDRITDAVVSTTARGRFKPVAPETMQEASMMDGDRNSKKNNKIFSVVSY